MKAKDSIRDIKGIGEKSEKLFRKLGITTVEELLAFYPREYDIYTKIQPVLTVQEGDTVVLGGSFPARLKMASVRGLKIITGQFRDSSGQILISWFNMPYLMKTVKVGMHYILRGKIVRKDGFLQKAQTKNMKKEE